MREPTRLNPAPAIAAKARAYFDSEKTRPYEFRVERLRALDASIRKHEQAIFDSMMADLHRPLHEAYPAEVGLVYEELKHSLKHLKSWLKPTHHGIPFLFWPARGYRVPQPLGTALIISPWNYPVLLAFQPLVGAIAAGCTVVLKPSEISVHTTKVVESMVKTAFGDDGFCTVATGDAEISKQLLAEKWDSIFFTGSTQVGRVVMEAAAKHLTPVTLELGGKSPAIVDENTNLDVTARRIVWGKFYNAGQTCIAPDYVLVHSKVHHAFVEKVGQVIAQFFGSDPKQSRDFGRIISTRHFKRLETLMGGGKVAFGGQVDEAERYIAPTVLTNVKVDHALMQEEIFGPLMPIIEVKDWQEAIRFVNARPKPLALYVFSNNSDRTDEVIERCPSGGAVVNDCILHIVAGELPFGGVGESGMGSYHGKASFDCFTHWKAVVQKPFAMDFRIRYPPYKTSLSVLKRLIG